MAPKPPGFLIKPFGNDGLKGYDSLLDSRLKHSGIHGESCDTSPQKRPGRLGKAKCEPVVRTFNPLLVKKATACAMAFWRRVQDSNLQEVKPRWFSRPLPYQLGEPSPRAF